MADCINKNCQEYYEDSDYNCGNVVYKNPSECQFSITQWGPSSATVKTGEQIILAYNGQDHQDMQNFTTLEKMIDEALAEARKIGADWGINFTLENTGGF